MSTAWALLSSAAYGVSDVAGGLGARRATATQVVLVAYPLSTLLAVLVALVALPGSPSATAWVWGAVSGVAMGLAMIAFYEALGRGPMSVVSPLTGVVVAVVPVVVALATGQPFGGWGWWGLALAVVAIVLVGLSPGGGRVAGATVVIAVAAGTFFALSLVALERVPDGGAWPLAAARAAASVTVLACALGLRQARVPPRAAWPFCAGVAVLDVTANAAALLAYAGGSLAVSSVVIALYPAFTVLVSVVVLRERLTLLQGVGLVAAGVGVALVSSSGG